MPPRITQKSCRPRVLPTIHPKTSLGLPTTPEDLGMPNFSSTLVATKTPSSSGPSYWVLTGDREHWRRGISDRIRGAVPGLQSAWEALQRGDFLFFYAKAPVSTIFGTGILRDKLRQDRPLWADEMHEVKV